MEIIEKILSVIGKILLVIWKAYKWFFIASYKLNMVLLGLIGLLFGVSSSPPPPPLPNDEENKQKIRQLQREIPSSKTEKVLEKFGKLEPNTPTEFQIIQKLKNSPGKPLNEVLSEEEMQILIMMLLKKLGII